MLKLSILLVLCFQWALVMGLPGPNVDIAFEPSSEKYFIVATALEGMKRYLDLICDTIIPERDIHGLFYREWFNVNNPTPETFDEFEEKIKELRDGYSVPQPSFVTIKDNDCLNQPTAYAITYRAQKLIYLCPNFWGEDVPIMGPLSHALILLHEWTHWVLDADDIALNEHDCLNLARDHPEQTLKNAYSYEFFAAAIPVPIQIYAWNGHPCIASLYGDTLNCRFNPTLPAEIFNTYGSISEGTNIKYVDEDKFLSDGVDGVLVFGRDNFQFQFDYLGNGAYNIYSLTDQQFAGWVSIDEPIEVHSSTDANDYKSYFRVSILGISSFSRTLNIRSTASQLYWGNGEIVTLSARPFDIIMFGPSTRCIFSSKNSDLTWSWLSYDGCSPMQMMWISVPATYKIVDVIIAGRKIVMETKLVPKLVLEQDADDTLLMDYLVDHPELNKFWVFNWVRSGELLSNERIENSVGRNITGISS